MIGYLLLGTGCTFDPSGIASGSPVDAGMAPDTSLPDPEVDAGPDAGMSTCTADTRTCGDADTLLVCRADGSGQDAQDCILGCADAPTPHCRAPVPSNGISPDALDAGDGVLDTAATGSLTFDTNTGRITRADDSELRPAGTGYDDASGIAFVLVPQTGAPAIGVFSLGALTVAPATTLRGIGDSALGLVSSDTVTIAGVVDVTGGAAACPDNPVFPDPVQCPGPGGNPGGNPDETAPGQGAGGPGRGSSNNGESGGGGGAHGAAGGRGGVGDDTAAGNGGQPFAAPNLIPLTGGGGGSGGGDEPSFNNDGAAGGGGGGAVQIVARTTIQLTTAAADPCGINAGGAGAGVPEISAGGGGGGAGGGILLEAPQVVVGAGCALAANGGGGSGGSADQRGTTGLLGATPAAGSNGDPGRITGDGGAGGAATSPAGGDGGDSGRDEGGGGGGSAGVVAINTRDGSSLTAEGTLSPAPATGTLVLE